MPQTICLLCSALLVIAAPLVARPDENSICGNIESGQLTIPSYRFDVADQNGDHLPDLTGRGALVIVEGVWRGGAFSGQWEDNYHAIPIGIAYDSQHQQYVSGELPKVKIERRKKGLAPFKTRCWDRVSRLTFEFGRLLQPEPKGLRGGQFVFNFPNKTLNEIGLPDPGVPIKIVVKKR
jgi:hypothetical protein